MNCTTAHQRGGDGDIIPGRYLFRLCHILKTQTFLFLHPGELLLLLLLQFDHGRQTFMILRPDPQLRRRRTAARST